MWITVVIAFIVKEIYTYDLMLKNLNKIKKINEIKPNK